MKILSISLSVTWSFLVVTQNENSKAEVITGQGGFYILCHHQRGKGGLKIPKYIMDAMPQDKTRVLLSQKI